MIRTVNLVNKSFLTVLISGEYVYDMLDTFIRNVAIANFGTHPRGRLENIFATHKVIRFADLWLSPVRPHIDVRFITASGT